MTGGRRQRARQLVFREDAGALAISVALAGTLAPVRRVESVPLAPSGVVGLTEIHGRPVTLLDPGLWLGRPPRSVAAVEERALALCFVPPFEHLALYVEDLRSLQPVREELEDAALLDLDALEGVLERMRLAVGAR